MDKNDFTLSYNKYGIKPENICVSRIGILGEAVEKICVIAPLHKVEAYSELGAKVTQLSYGYYPAYKVEYENYCFTFITTQIGAPNADEIVVALAYSNCEKIIFTGSCGALKDEYKIGDILLPNYSLSGDGATRYFTKSAAQTNDTYAKKFYPTKKLNDELIRYLTIKNINFRQVNNFSIDTIVGQFLHIDEFLSLGADVIEMETASVFCLAETLKIEAVAVLNVSDSTVAKKSLLAGRTKEELLLHKYTENYTVPKLILGFISSINEKKIDEEKKLVSVR